ncbi:MAG TPA: MobF family relaxase, partial [Actinomycetes bacterium]|nr:MobF family relaxase [Actinomycetes bacterium]
MAWFRRMGVEQVAYHEATVLGREDDHAGQALDYYGSRGETPLRWGGAGAARLGLEGGVTRDVYRLAFGPGGFRDPLTGQRLVRTKRPGFELVVAAHKSLSLLGVVGRADDMHAILDAQTAGTMGYLEAWAQSRGGRRGRAMVATPTSGLVYAVTRHGTSREGDPHAHDHALVANVCEMRDTAGGYKALKSDELRDRDEAATMVGRLHSAARAVELGYAIEPDRGRSGRARDWRIVGIPAEVCEVFSKRSDAIADYLEEMGYTSYRARNVAARRNRPVKRGTGTDQLMACWIAELETHGWNVERLAASLEQARLQCRGLARPLTDSEIDSMAAHMLDPEGEFLARWKVFDRPRLVADIAPLLYGHDPAELDRVVDRVLASELVVPLVNIAGASDQRYTATAVLATEHTITYALERFTRRQAPVVARGPIEQVTAAKQTELGRELSAGQRQAVERICSEGRAIDVIVGVAGSGKTTALDVAARALEATGYQVLGTATSGQAARTLHHHARIPSGTVRSLLWRLDHGQVTLGQRSVLVLDEASLTADIHVARLLLAVNRAGGRLVIVGDPRQLAPVGPGGALQALVERHPDIVTVLNQNLRQRNPAERAALHHLRAGNVQAAVGFYAANGRIRIAPTRTETLAAMVDAWAADTTAGHDTLMLAWRRNSVADLNRLARVRADQRGWLSGPDLDTPDGRSYAVGDPVVTLAPNDDSHLVTSQRGRIVAIDQRAQTLTMATDDGRRVVLRREALDQDHLDHGYALTAHREQGATADRTHYLAEGGGRELPYVAMSRARGPSSVHAVADDVAQAIEDITHDWSLDRNQQWITRTATAAGVDPAIRARSEDPDARRARLLAELEALEGHAPPDVTAELAAARAELDRMRRSRDDLVRGADRW